MLSCILVTIGDIADEIAGVERDYDE